MFDIGWSELMLIGIVALIVIGPKELPAVLRTVGRTVTRLRRMAGEFQGQFQEALREADVADMRKEIADVTDSARSSLSSVSTKDLFDPLRSIRDEIRGTVEGATKAMQDPVAAAGAALTSIASTPAPAAPAPADPLQSVRDEIRAAVTKAAGPVRTAPPPEAHVSASDAPAQAVVEMSEPASVAERLEAMLPPPPAEPLPIPVFDTPTGPVVAGLNPGAEAELSEGRKNVP